MQSHIPICDYQGSSWRTEFWPGREYEDRAERIALARLLPPSGQRLVEIGAGFGRLANLYSGYDRVILLDYARSMLEDARSRLGGDPRFSYVVADLYDLPFADNAFDTAVTVRVLHHVADIPCAFAEIARVVRPRGAYVTDFANKRHLKAVLKYWLAQLRGRAVPAAESPFSLAPYEFVKLNFDYHPSYISQELARVGLSIREARAVSTFRLPVVKQLVPPALLARLDGLIQRPTARLQLSPSVFLRIKADKPGPAEPAAALWRCPRCRATGLAESSHG